MNDHETIDPEVSTQHGRFLLPQQVNQEAPEWNEQERLVRAQVVLRHRSQQQETEA